MTSSNFTSGGDFKVVRGEHKVKLRGGPNDIEDDPPRPLGLFEIYGILLVMKNTHKQIGRQTNIQRDQL
jgi:hypothetical protein